MPTVSERIKDSLETARSQLVGFERKFEATVEGLEKKAKESLDEVPGQFKGAWDTVLVRLRGALDVATHDELHALGERVDELAEKVAQLLKRDKPKPSSK